MEHELRKVGTRGGVIVRDATPADAGAACEVMRASIAELCAADLEFLRRKRRIRSGNFKSKSGTRVIGFLVPMTFRSS